MNVDEAIERLRALSDAGHGRDDLRVWDEYRWEYVNEIRLAEPKDGIGHDVVIV